MSTEVHGIKQVTDALQGHGLQSQEEWAARSRTLTGTLVEPIIQ